MDMSDIVTRLENLAEELEDDDARLVEVAATLIMDVYLPDESLDQASEAYLNEADAEGMEER